MQGMQSVPLRLDLVDEGRFLVEANEDLEGLQRELIAYVGKHGKDRAKGAKAELTLRIVLKFDGKDPTDYSVLATSKKAVPARPPSVSKALGGGRMDEEGRLWVLASGSSGSTPKQGKLCTDDGREIDPVTGKAAPTGGS